MDNGEKYLLLDPVSRKVLKLNLTALSGRLKIVSTLSEVSHNSTLIYLEPFLQTEGSLTELILYKEIFNLDLIYFGSDSDYLNIAKIISNIIKMEISLVDHRALLASVEGDTAYLENREMPLIHNIKNLCDRIKNDDKSTTASLRLVEDALNLSEGIKNLLIENKELSDRNLNSLVQLDKLSRRLISVEKSYKNLLKSSIELNESMEQLEFVFTKDVYEKIDLSRYPNRPLILYLKEYEELIHMNSLLETLYDVFKNQYKIPVKVLRLFDSGSGKKLATLPSYYTILKNSFKVPEVLSNPFISKIGDYQGILDILLTNDNQVDLLLVVDCKDHMSDIFTGIYPRISLCRNPKNVEKFSLSKNTTIVNNNDVDKSWSWDTYKEYKKLESEDLFLFLSSRPLIQNIVSVYKHYANNKQDSW